jgi:hypothetical protein
MSTGLSIFLTAVFLGMVALYISTHEGGFLVAVFVLLGVVALYVSTRDRWDWKKLVRKTIGWSIVVAGTLLVLYALVGLGLYIHQRRVALSESKPIVQDRYWDITLGATKADVKFVKGKPTTEGDTWVYNETPAPGYAEDTMYTIFFNADRVCGVLGQGARFEGLQRITNYSTLDDLREKFGEPTEVRTSADNLRRWFLYGKYHLVFQMSMNKVEAVGVYDPRVCSIGPEEKPPETIRPDPSKPGHRIR